MGKSILQVSAAVMEIPLAGKSADVAISNAVKTMSSELTLDEQATAVRLSFTGSGDVRVTYDGQDPSTSSGELWFQGGILTVNPEMFNVMKMIRGGTVDGAVHITQLSGGRLR